MPMNFVMAMSFRDRIEALSEEEGNPEDADVLNKRLYHTYYLDRPETKQYQDGITP